MEKTFKLLKLTDNEAWDDDIDLLEVEGQLTYVSDVFMSENDEKSLIDSIYNVWPRENGGWMEVPKISLEQAEESDMIIFDGELVGFVKEVMSSDFEETQICKAGRFQLVTKRIKGTHHGNGRFAESWEDCVVTDPNGEVTDHQVVVKNSDPWRQFLNVCHECGRIRERDHIEGVLCTKCAQVVSSEE